MLHDVLVRPLINLLVAIYAILPGHDLGIAIIVFTILVRFALWPLVRKQIRQQRALRELQPEINKIRSNTKGDKQKEALLIMELYREREINPFASFGLILIQFPILIALFAALRTILKDGRIVEEAYTVVKNLGYMKEIVQTPSLFTPHFFGMNLGKPSIVLAAGAAIGQYIQTRQMMPRPKQRKRLSEILRKTAQSGDNSEAIAAMNQGMGPVFSILMFFAASTLPSALALYWTTGSIVAIGQQRFVLNQDVAEAEKVKVTISNENQSEADKPKSANRKAKRGGKKK